MDKKQGKSDDRVIEGFFTSTSKEASSASGKPTPPPPPSSPVRISKDASAATTPKKSAVKRKTNTQQPRNKKRTPSKTQQSLFQAFKLPPSPQTDNAALNQRTASSEEHIFPLAKDYPDPLILESNRVTEIQSLCDIYCRSSGPRY